MIKTPVAGELINFSNYVGFILAKGNLKDLSKSDVEPILDVTVSILEVALKEPRFRAQYLYKLVYDLFGNCLFSTLSKDSALKLFPRAMKNEIVKESRSGIQDGIWYVIYSLLTPAAKFKQELI